MAKAAKRKEKTPAARDEQRQLLLWERAEARRRLRLQREIKRLTQQTIRAKSAADASLVQWATRIATDAGFDMVKRQPVGAAKTE